MSDTWSTRPDPDRPDPDRPDPDRPDPDRPDRTDWGQSGQPPAPYGQPQPYGQQPSYGQPPSYGQQPSYAPGPWQQYPADQHWSHGQSVGPVPRPTNGFAIASMVLGILWIYWIGSILALVFGYLARRQIRERHEGGNAMAVAGIVLGWIGVGVLVLLLAVAVAASISSAP